ncbi:hypothetical protein C5Y96_24495 [Blastopirellula marina]|uniref:Tetratricopeptide repeat-like domain-containing protein n=1 Tax=Blastopirellula marina TaxID=124 RepID=A0A2S8F014_9BACT|nr:MULTISPECIES: hypothetical protein [Pirellulaceae]PQO25503.1 hypothetical protein C5Y96_24495 [Blastopirellula marina]RCS42467.1 hypothetical protein DTL36_24545 [Bremerella cremea]
MKSERRHEIQENSLAHFLEGILEQAKPHATMIGGVALALLLGFVGYAILNTDSGIVKHEEWNAVYSTLDQSFRVGEDDVKRQEVAQEFATLSTDFGTTRPALWAEYFYGQQNLTQASDLAFSDPQSATADIERALKSFQKVYDSADMPVLKVKALWGMAEAYELQATKESLAKAKSNYEEILVIWPDTNTALLAEERIKRLDNQGVDGFYAWYRDQDFVARAAEVEKENRAPLQGTVPGMDMNLEAPGGGLFDAPGAGATPGAGNSPLFTPSMDLKGADGEGAAPKPSSFTEKEKEAAEKEAADKAAEPMSEEAKADPAAESTDKPKAESTEEAPSEEKPAAEEKPASEEPAKEEAAKEKAE